MKIAVFYNLNFGGAKRAVQEQVKGLKKLGHSIDVYTLDQEHDALSPSIYSDKEFIFKFKIRYNSMPIVSRIIKDYYIFFVLKKVHKKIATEIDSRGYDVVLLHSDLYTQSPYLAHYLKTKSIYYIMEPLKEVNEYALRIPNSRNIFIKSYEIINRNIRNKIDVSNARASTKSLALSYSAKFYASIIYDLYPIVSYLGVNEKIFSPRKLKKKNQLIVIAPKDYIFGYDLAQNALKLIPQKIRPELKIILGVNKNVRFTDEEVAEEYNKSIAALSLSRLDTFGLVPLEAMACGIPVIATNISAYREIVVDKKTGLLVEFDEKDLAEKILFLINNPKIAIKMGEEGRTAVLKNWTWDIQSKLLEKNILELVNKDMPSD